MIAPARGSGGNAQTALCELPAAGIVHAIADAAGRWRDGDFPPRVRTLARIAQRTNYSEPVAEYALDALFGAIDAGSISRTIELELGSLATLDAVRFGYPAREVRPAGHATLVSSDTTIGVALFPLVFALAAKCDVTVKDRSDDLIAAFAATLAEERPEFARALTVRRWESHDDPDVRSSLERSDTIVAFGGDEALRRIRALCPPEARFVGYGRRTSVAYVEREALADTRTLASLTDRIARDALLYDGEGCLSPHAIAVERGAAVTAAEFATELAHAFERTAIEFPTSARGIASVHAAAQSGSFRAAVAGESARLFRASGDRSLIFIDPPEDAPPPLDPCVVALYGVDEPAHFAEFLVRHGVPLEAVGVAAAARVRPEVATAFARLRVNRFADLGEMQRPALGAPHGGVARILPFVRYAAVD